MIAKRVWLHIGLFALPSMPSAAGAQATHEPFLFPQLASFRDEQYIAFIDNCGEGRLREPVVLRQGVGNTWTLEATLVATDTPVCFSVPGGPGSAVHAVRIRPLELQTPEIRVDIDGPAAVAVDGEVQIQGVATQIPPSIDGAWHDPANPGQGLYLAQTRASGRHDVSVVALWATYQAGQPLWLTGVAVNEGAHRVTLPLFRTAGGAFPGQSAAPVTAEAWGTLDLEYVGCHRMRVSWQALDAAAFPPGSREFRQFTPDITHECDIRAFAKTVAEEVFIHEPVVVRLP